MSKTYTLTIPSTKTFPDYLQLRVVGMIEIQPGRPQELLVVDRVWLDNGAQLPFEPASLTRFAQRLAQEDHG